MSCVDAVVDVVAHVELEAVGHRAAPPFAGWRDLLRDVVAAHDIAEGATRDLVAAIGAAAAKPGGRFEEPLLAFIPPALFGLP